MILSFLRGEYIVAKLWSPYPFILIVSPVLVDLFLGSVSGGIPVCRSSEYGRRPHTASRRIVPSCCTRPLVNVVLREL
jgi:hypothetical protein